MGVVEKSPRLSMSDANSYIGSTAKTHGFKQSIEDGSTLVVKNTETDEPIVVSSDADPVTAPSSTGYEESQQLRKKWLQQWLSRNNNAGGNYLTQDASSHFSVEKFAKHTNASTSVGADVRNANNSLRVSEYCDTVSVIPQTLLLYSYDNEIIHNIGTQYIRNGADPSAEGGGGVPTSPHTTANLFKPKVFETKFVLRNCGGYASTVMLRTSTPEIRIVGGDGEMAVNNGVELLKDGNESCCSNDVWEVKVNAHTDVCIRVKYNSSIHAMQRQFHDLFIRHGDMNSKPSDKFESCNGNGGKNITSAAMMSIGMMSSCRNAHIGYILLTTHVHHPENVGSNAANTRELVVEVKYHPQYLYQLVYNVIDGQKRKQKGTKNFGDSRLSMQPEFGKQAKKMDMGKKAQIGVPLNTKCQSEIVEEKRDSMSLEELLGSARNGDRNSIDEYCSPSKVIGGDNNDGRIYFRLKEADFGCISANSVGKVHVDLCNSTGKGVIIVFAYMDLFR